MWMRQVVVLNICALDHCFTFSGGSKGVAGLKIYAATPLSVFAYGGRKNNNIE